MTVTLLPEQERLLQEIIDSGLAKTPKDALARALELLRDQIPSGTSADESRAEVTKRLAEFRTKHALSLGDLTIRDLLNASRP